MVIIEIKRDYAHYDRILGEHLWSEFLQKPTMEEKDRVTQVFYCTYNTGRNVQKNGGFGVHLTALSPSVAVLAWLHQPFPLALYSIREPYPSVVFRLEAHRRGRSLVQSLVPEKQVSICYASDLSDLFTYSCATRQIKFPYPPTHFCDVPVEDRTSHPLCRPLPGAVKTPPPVEVIAAPQPGQQTFFITTIV